MVSRRMASALIMDTCHGVGDRSHLARAGDVLRRTHRLPHPVVECIVGGEFLIRRLQPLLGNVPIRLVLQQPGAEAHRFAQTLSVPGIHQIAVIQARSNTERFASSVQRVANTHPADPPPMTITSYFMRPSALGLHLC